MTKILFICRHFIPEKSGMATQMYNQVKFLSNHKNFEVRVVRITNDPKTSKNEFVSGTLPFKPKLSEELAELKLNFKPDLVHFDSIWPAGRCITEVFKDTPKFISVGGRIFDEFEDYYKYTKSNFFAGKLKGIFLKFLAKKVINKTQAVFAEGSDIKEHLEKNSIKTKIYTLNNGIDVSRFKYTRGKGKKILFFGRYSWENGPDRFIEIVKDLPGFQGVLVGYGPMKDELTERANQFENIEVKGPVEWNEIPQLLASFDYILLPFRRIGGISQTVTESMASGRIVVTTNVGDLGNVIEPKKTGFFFESNQEVRKIIMKLSSNMNERRKIEKNAKRRINTDFTWPTVVDKYVKIYRNYVE